MVSDLGSIVVILGSDSGSSRNLCPVHPDIELTPEPNASFMYVHLGPKCRIMYRGLCLDYVVSVYTY